MNHQLIKTYSLHFVLFALTLAATTASGAEWIFGGSFFVARNPMDWQQFWHGLHFSVPFLLILTFHEFGHYFTAKYYKIDVSLPYYVPFWLGWLGMPLSIGTMGAFIRLQSRLKSRQEFFDVGIAGPLAGFVLALICLWYGFTHLPPPEYIFNIHPEYREFGINYADFVYKDLPQGANMEMGTNLIFEFFKYFVADPELLPNPHEIMHYPYLLAGYLALFFTALNLIPIGQLDGGHILYALIGAKSHKKVSFGLFIIFMFYAGLGLFSIQELINHFFDQIHYALLYVLFLFFTFRKTVRSPIQALPIAIGLFTMQLAVKYLMPTVEVFAGWLLFGMLLGTVLGVYHPPAQYDAPLNRNRQLLGWITLIIFVLCFSPQPFVLK